VRKDEHQGWREVRRHVSQELNFLLHDVDHATLGNTFDECAVLGVSEGVAFGVG